ncbi:Uncharacterised protein [Candidatus Bilamarchaeum dharawalense]|uniref:Uncharacterized protein n=1 Tax=Candidatus Bilamarchaeum dharawalense TaxID=2885759 RepID=A0A5E4LR50_9ARCH|nr:Uncharacterised protein [Candidatus Bilamarchaeum dharawalense]
MVLQNAVDIVSSTSGITWGSVTIFPGLWSYVAFAGAALFTSIVFLSAMYLWAVMFRNQQLNSYVKQELQECFVTALLIPLIFGMIAGLDHMAVGNYVPMELLPEDVDQTTNVYQAAQQYYERVEADMSAWLNLNYIMNIYVDQTASVTPYARPLGVGLVASPLTGIASPLKQLLYNMTTALSLAFIINHAQLVVYLFSLQAFLNFYLPLGIFFRSFTPTRRLGGTLIGVALTFLFIFPALSTLTYSIFYNRSGGPLMSFDMLLGQYFGDYTGGFGESLSNYYVTNFNSGSGGVMDIVGGVLGGLGDLIQMFIGKLFLILFIIPMSMISFAFTIGFVIPAINIIIYTAAAKVLSKQLGEEVDISSLTRMI